MAENNIVIDMEGELFLRLQDYNMTTEFINLVDELEDVYTNYTGVEDRDFITTIYLIMFASLANNEVVRRQHTMNGQDFETMKEQINKIYEEKTNVLMDHGLIAFDEVM
jgi:hypothetical protein